MYCITNFLRYLMLFMFLLLFKYLMLLMFLHWKSHDFFLPSHFFGMFGLARPRTRKFSNLARGSAPAAAPAAAPLRLPPSPRPRLLCRLGALRLLLAWLKDLYAWVSLLLGLLCQAGIPLGRNKSVLAMML
jgi:hypothetical protein